MNYGHMMQALRGVLPQQMQGQPNGRPFMNGGFMPPGQMRHQMPFQGQMQTFNPQPQPMAPNGPMQQPNFVPPGQMKRFGY